MASLVSTGSPRLSRRSTPTVKVLDENNDDGRTPTNKPIAPIRSQPGASKGNVPTPLQTDTLSNLQPLKRQDKIMVDTATTDGMAGMQDILARLRLNESRKPSATHPYSDDAKLDSEDLDNLDKLLTGLNVQNKTLKKQKLDLKDESDSDANKVTDCSSGSDLFTPATDSFGINSSAGSQDSDTIRINFDKAEMLRVKKELEAAKLLISHQNEELAETRSLKHTMDQAMGPPSEIDFSEQHIGHMQSAFNASARPFTSSHGGWHSQDDSRSDQADTFTVGSFPKPRGVWNNPTAVNGLIDPVQTTGLLHNPRETRAVGHNYGNVYGNQQLPDNINFQQSRTFSGSSVNSLGYDGRMYNDLSVHGTNPGMRRNQSQFRSNSTLSDPLSPYGNFHPGMANMSPPSLSPMAVANQYGFQPRSVGAPITSMPGECPVSSMQGHGAPFTMAPAAANGQVYVTASEPTNYRRLLDKSVSCDWKTIVDRIVCNNDQQASIFLQQKLKVGTAEQKFDIVESIVNQAYPLMINRFGNFLVQRCFEHGTPEQLVAIASAIHGNVLSLSMDPFGCHVIQKAFDSVPEDHKADMVRELLRRIPDTVIHRYACHVWQKLFELRWSGEPPQIMLKVNEALRGMWHEVALGETGSLVVQNIFENCVEEEKRPAIEEVITNIDLIAHGQFGNWCIQHLCEHGSPPDKRRVIDHILTNSYNYSIDQFASKVVEKCLKIGGIDFLDRYLGVITTAHPDRPRIPLIDIAGDQYGNYLIQWILMNTHHHQREQVAIHIRKHMVSLRGSKFGSRVAMLCCNPNSVTRPGPGAIVNPYGAPGQPRAPWPRFR